MDVSHYYISLEMTILSLCRFWLRPISKWPPTEIRRHFSKVGPRQFFSLTSNEVNKTIKPWSPFDGHRSQIFYPTINKILLDFFFLLIRSYFCGDKIVKNNIIFCTSILPLGAILDIVDMSQNAIFQKIQFFSFFCI